MNDDSITLTASEQRRLTVLTELESGRLSKREAAELLGVSERQVRRLRTAFRRRGAAAVVHGNRGRRPVNALPPQVAGWVVELATNTYHGFNQQHLTEMLAERENLPLSRPTVHRILTEAGVSAPRRRRPPKHRQRRDRYPREGMLLQLDGSPHDWLEGRGPRLSLLGAIDDATNLVPWGVFRDQEDAEGYFQLMHQIVIRYGIPMAVYSDHHSIFWMTKNKELSLEEQLAGRRQPTQFGRLLDELGVELVLAHSPQAKGRIERLWGTFQDRLVSELRLAKASTRLEAQEVLVDLLPRHNQRFTIPAAELDSAWVPWPADRHLEEYFCFKYRRVVARDNTVRFEGYLLDIPPQPTAAWLAPASRSTSASTELLPCTTAASASRTSCLKTRPVSTASAATPKPAMTRLRSRSQGLARSPFPANPGSPTQVILGGVPSRVPPTLPPDKVAELLGGQSR